MAKGIFSRIQDAIFGRREDEDDESEALIGDETIGISDLNRTIGSKSKYQLFRTYRGFLEEDPNPLLIGKNAIIEFDKMRTVDVQVTATLLAAELPIRATEWSIAPGKTMKWDRTHEVTPEDQEIADFVKYNIFTNCRTSFDDYLRLSLGMLWAGFSIFEKVYEEKQGKIMLKKLADRPQTTISHFFDLDGNLNIEQIGSKELIPGWKVIIHSYRKEGDNFSGRSALRPAFQNWTYKTKLYRLDGIAHERNSLKVPVITTPDGVNEDEKKAAKDIAKNLKSTEGAHVILPGEKWKIEFLGDGSQNEGIMKSISHHNREISKALLAQFIELGAEGKGGSYALSEDHSDLFKLGLTAIANQVARVTNEFIIRELVDVNFDMKDGQEYPTLEFDKIGDIDIGKIIEGLSSLAEKNIITPDNTIEDKMRDLLDLPKAIYGDDGKVAWGREVQSPKIDLSSLTAPKDPQAKGKKIPQKKFSEESEYTGCVMLSLEDLPSIEIASEDLSILPDGTGGRETYPHVTILYGLDTSLSLDQIKERIDYHGQDVEIVGMRIFEKEDQDILVFEVRKDRFLDESNRNLRILPNENKYPIYTPHITIAYLKKGTAAKYISHDHDGKMVKTTEIVYTKDLTANSVKLFTEQDIESKIFSEILSHFDPIDMAKLSSLIK